MDCYTYEDWIKRQKRKATARFQLHQLRPDLEIFTADGSEFVEEAWKKFKKDFNITKASKRSFSTEAFLICTTRRRGRR